MGYQWLAVLVLVLFYGIYLGKMAGQRRRGIQTDQIAKGEKDKRLYRTELVMKLATYSIAMVQVISVWLDVSWMPGSVRAIGFCLGMLGDLIFAMAVWTMKDSWRAGIPEKDRTDFVSTGIYRYSRNPAFLGFDLMYAGVLCLFFNPVLLIFTIFAMGMLHLQILREEEFLPTAFGEQYLEYKRQVPRYLGRR